MPVTDLSDDDWLQQYLAGQAAVPGGGPATWPPYGGHPMNYGPPAPSLGGPPQPAQSAPDPNASALGWSLTSNPITRGLNALNPVSSAQASVLGGKPSSPSRPLPPGAANSLPLASGNPTLEGYNQWLQMQLGQPPGPAATPAGPATAPPAPRGPGGIGSDANFPVMGAGGFPTTYASPGAQPPTLAGVAGVNPANRGVGTNRTPGAGAPQGNPAQTPRPANSSLNLGRYPPFSMIDRANAAATAGQPGRGYQTALDLSGLFGGRSQAQAPAANPADVPARNAMPTSGAMSAMSNAPWGMGPLQKGMNWPGSYGPDWRTWAAAHSGFQ